MFKDERYARKKVCAIGLGIEVEQSKDGRKVK